MKAIKILSLIIIASALLACSFTVNVPAVHTGPTQTYDIKVDAPQGVTTADVEINMGAGSLNISGGASDLVSGVVQYNIADWKPEVVKTNSGVRLSQGKTENIRIPEGNVINDWSLQLGPQPMNLTINAGAYKGKLDLGGLSITDLQIEDGASKATVDFSQPNLVKMNTLIYKTGASQVDLVNLANANAAKINFQGGAGSYTLDFLGQLTSDVDVHISAGMGNVKIILPLNAHAIVSVTGGASNINAYGAWNISGTTYEMTGTGPLINIQIEMALGNIDLSNR